MDNEMSSPSDTSEYFAALDTSARLCEMEEEDAVVGAAAREQFAFVQPLSDFLRCPLHGGVLRDPVIARCGHSFCRKKRSKTSYPFRKAAKRSV